MEPKRKAKGSWGVRFFIFVLAIALGILFYWVLNFVVKDIGRIKGPDREAIRAEYIAPSLDEQKESAQKDITRLNRQISKLSEQSRNLKNSTGNLQNTINQLLSIQKQSIDKGGDFPEKSLQTLSESQTAFLDNQRRDQELNRQISEITIQRQVRQDELDKLIEQIAPLEEDFNAEWELVLRKYNWKVAAFKLAFLIPVFLVVSILFMKYRTGAYWSIIWASFIASFVKIAVVANRYLSEEIYFKYIAIAVIIAIVLRLLVYLIRMIIAPKKDLLVKQYQQLYDKCQCPVCAKPIRMGPLRYIGGFKKKMPVQVASSEDLTKAQAYTCPSCGTGLYHKCEKCTNIRHSLLPYCEHCGDETIQS